MSPNNEAAATFRVVVLGPARVGKSAILRRYLFGDYTDRYRETIEDLHDRDFIVKGIPITLHFFDTNITFADMRRLAIGSASAFIIVFAVDNVQSFKEMSDLWTEIAKQRADFRTIPAIIAGAKSDVEAKKIYEATAHAWTSRLNANVDYVECSAKLNVNVAAIFSRLLELSHFPSGYEHLPSPVNEHQPSLQRSRSRSHSRSRSSSTQQQKVRPTSTLVSFASSHQQHRDLSTPREFKSNDERLGEQISASLVLPFGNLSPFRRNHSMRVPRKLPPSPTFGMAGDEKKSTTKNDYDLHTRSGHIRRSNHLSLRLNNKTADEQQQRTRGDRIADTDHYGSDCRVS